MPGAGNAYKQLLEGNGAGFEDQFQQGVVDPAMKTYSQDILPAIEQRFTDANAGSSSALNQALSKSSEDLTSMLGGQRIQYQQGQQQLQQQGQLGALGQIMQMLNARKFDPIVQGPQGGMLKDLIGAAGNIGAGFAMKSSIYIKDNIRDYPLGLETVRFMDAKRYDYTIDVPGRRTDRVGFIAEEMPKELQADADGVTGIDVYGLVATLLNAVKQLDARLNALEAR